MSKLEQLRKHLYNDKQKIDTIKKQQGYYLIIGKFNAVEGDNINSIFNLIGKGKPIKSKHNNTFNGSTLTQDSEFYKDGSYSQYIFKVLTHKNNDVIDNNPTDINNPNNMTQQQNNAPTKNSRWKTLPYHDLISLSRYLKYLSWCHEDALNILKIIPNAYIIPFSRINSKFNQKSIKNYLFKVWDYLVNNNAKQDYSKFSHDVNTKSITNHPNFLK